LSSLAYRLIAIDLDGTLLNSEHALAEANRAAIHRAHEAGVQVVLCTGRAYPETKPIVEEIGLDLDATVTVFGAVVTEVASGRSIELSPFEDGTAAAVADWFRAREYAVLWLIDGASHGFDGYVIDGPRRHLAIDGYLAASPVQMEAVSARPTAPLPALRLSVIDDPEDLKTVARDLRAAFDGRIASNVLYAPSWNLTVIESFAPQVNKWYGIEKLCRRWGIRPEETIAVGDDVNDVEMVSRAGLGVAMGNARAEVKAVARHTTGPNDAGGVAQVIDDLLAGRLPGPQGD
jgi:5-amino-6-(5-phospho-D-ribitylamino)uracil phosphatase